MFLLSRPAKAAFSYRTTAPPLLKACSSMVQSRPNSIYCARGENNLRELSECCLQMMLRRREGESYLMRLGLGLLRVYPR